MIQRVMALKKTVRNVESGVAFICILIVVYFCVLNYKCKEISSTKFINRQILFESMEWEWEDSLNSNGRILIKWNSTKEDITMLVIAATTGYVGIGFALNREMNGSDIVIGWIQDGKAFLQDLHATGNSQPIVDSQQDYQLLFGTENKSHTILCFKRKLNTNDKDDVEITESTIALLWAFSDKNPSGRPSYHGKTRGSSWLNLLYTKYKDPSLDNLEYFEVGTNKTRTPYKLFSFYYWCHFVKLPNFGEKRHYVGFQHKFQLENQHLIHHVVINLCDGENLDETFGSDSEGHLCYTPQNFLKESACRQIIASSSLKEKSTFLPPHVGYEFGSTDTKPMYILVQFHYSYDYYIKDFQDTSTVRLYHTRNLRQYEGGSMQIAAKHFQIIPAKQKDFPTIGICSSSCLQKHLPANGIKIFAVGFHAHSSVKKMRLHHFRDGIEINTFSNDNYYFRYMNMRYLKEDLLVLPNDKLAVECVHDTSDRNETTTTGLSTYQEMCFVILDFHPKIDLAVCYSALDPLDVKQVTGNYIFTQNDLVSLLKAPFAYLTYFITMGFYLPSRSLNNSQATQLRNLYLKGNHISLCLNGSSPLEYNTDERVSFL